ncbi:MAG: zinc ribbon domain-containing protein [Candidatus Onthovivens sp.]
MFCRSANYTSQTYPCCRHINRENRKKQEMFSYITCRHTNNADVNVTINTIS